MTNNTANREYKDSVFTKLCADKKRLIEIYNRRFPRSYDAISGLTPMAA
jgi:hypothetical protein